MELLPNLMFVTKLTNQEIRLVGLALSLKIKPGSKEASEAHKLNLKMLRQRVTVLNELTQVATGALAHAEAFEQEQQKQESPPVDNRLD